MTASGFSGSAQRWFDRTLRDLGRQFRWSYLPPLMVYFAAGVSGLTAVVGTFFVKDYLGLSVAFLAGLAFWVGIPWALKMPLGHIVDLIWRWKAVMIYLGAVLIAAGMLIMYGLITDSAAMQAYMSVEAWYVTSALLTPSGYVIQDVVADAMTVEAVPTADPSGRIYSEEESTAFHTTMQTLGRFAIISGLVFVAALNIFMFTGIEQLSEADKAAIYADIYLSALVIPVISIGGVVLASILRRRQVRRLRARGLDEQEIEQQLYSAPEDVEPNWWILGGSAAFVAFTLVTGLRQGAYSQEIVFAGSMGIVLFLMARLLRYLDAGAARALVGTAVIIFVFRATPLPGAGVTWFEIDILGFDQRFIAILGLIASLLTLAGMVVLRPMMASKSIAYIVALLTIAAGFLSLPNIGLYYGIHEWTAPLTNGVVDAQFIAIIDTAIESPLGQIAMIPMLAWIARNAPSNLKATFFAVMASFTNLALSASSLATKYLNQIFVVSREVRDPSTGDVTVAADYSTLGLLLISVALIGLAAPLITILVVQHSRLRTSE